MKMLYRGYSTFILSSSLLSHIAAKEGSYWAGWKEHGPSWQWAGPDNSADYWLEHTKDALNIMQDTYWNGTSWVQLREIPLLMEKV
jgi:hypothetical protein